MTEQHPITPPPDLILEWCKGWNCTAELTALKGVATQAARWGSDQELEACCEWLKAKEWIHPEFSDELRADRRPKPPSLAEQALDAQRRMWDGGSSHADWELIRRALERLQELEQ